MAGTDGEARATRACRSRLVRFFGPCLSRSSDKDSSRTASAAPAAPGAVRRLDEKPRKYLLAKPKNVDPLSNLLGYPDFFQIKAEEPEESLSTVNITNGYCEHNFLTV